MWLLPWKKHITNPDPCYFAPWRGHTVVVDDPQDGNIVGVAFLRKCGVAVGQDDGAGRRLVVIDFFLEEIV